MPFAPPATAEVLTPDFPPIEHHTLGPVCVPRDECTHDFPVEWWYFAARVATRDGREQLSLMLTAIRGTKWVLPAATVSFFKRIDHRRGPYHLLQSGTAFDLAYRQSESPVTYRFEYASGLRNLWFASPERWQIEGEPGRYAIRLWNSAGAPELDLTLVDDAAPVLLGDRGVVDYGHDHRLAYWARPKLRVEGLARIDGHLEAVTGRGWYERQWGVAPTDRYAWKYLNVTLDDGEQWIFYHTKLAGTERYYAAHLPAEGGLFPIPFGQADFKNLSRYGRPTGTTIGMQTPAGRLELTIEPLFASEPEIESMYPGVPSFWESACRVEGTRNGVPVTGWSMTELHAYE